MAVEPCRSSPAQGRSSGSGHQHDLHAPLCTFSHARHRYGGGYGRRAAPKSVKNGHTSKNAHKGVANQKRCFTKKTQADSDSSALNRTSEGLLKLPDLEGITYQVVPAQNGQQCIVARGDTVPQKDSLMAAGFKWNPQRKIWWKYAA